MLNIIGIIIFIISGFCFLTAFILLVVIMKTVKNMDNNKKVAEMESVILKPLNSCIVLVVVGVISFIVSRLLII